jgi:hypothetical protein
MNYNCYYCGTMLHTKGLYNYGNSHKTFKCVNCFRTDLFFLKEELIEVALTGDKSKHYIYLIFKNTENGCQLKIKTENPMHISESKMTYEQCVCFFKKFDNIKAFL